LIVLCRTDSVFIVLRRGRDHLYPRWGDLRGRRKRGVQAQKLRVFFIFLFWSLPEPHRLALPRGLVARRPEKEGFHLGVAGARRRASSPATDAVGHARGRRGGPFDGGPPRARRPQTLTAGGDQGQGQPLKPERYRRCPAGSDERGRKRSDLLWLEGTVTGRLATPRCLYEQEKPSGDGPESEPSPAAFP